MAIIAFFGFLLIIWIACKLDDRPRHIGTTELPKDMKGDLNPYYNSGKYVK